MKAWLGLGSNQQKPVKQVRLAIAGLANSVDIEVLQASSFYSTPPWGDENQADFINAVVQVETRLKPLELLHRIQEIENQMGRERSARRWGPRCIDIDILLYADQTIRADELEIPHPRMHERCFVLLPLSELEPDLEIPARGTVAQNLLGVDCAGIQRLENQGDNVCDLFPNS